MHCNFVCPLNDPKLFLKSPVKRYNQNHLALDTQTEKEHVRPWRHCRFTVQLFFGSVGAMFLASWWVYHHSMQDMQRVCPHLYSYFSWNITWIFLREVFTTLLVQSQELNGPSSFPSHIRKWWSRLVCLNSMMLLSYLDFKLAESSEEISHLHGEQMNTCGI